MKRTGQSRHSREANYLMIGMALLMAGFVLQFLLDYGIWTETLGLVLVIAAAAMFGASLRQHSQKPRR